MSSLSESQITAHLDRLCKPPGSLGTLETIALRLCRIQQTLAPTTHPRHISVFAADHGVTSEGVSAWPSEVTGAVTEVMGRGRTASGVFARSLGCAYEVIDVGLIKPCSPPVLNRASRRGTANLRRESAMSIADFHHAWSVGVERATIACDAGSMILMAGEMGIGNTTSASCLIGLMCDVEGDSVVGRGAGIDHAGLARKREVVHDAIKRVREIGKLDTRRIACEIGGLEIVSLAGFYAESAARGRAMIVDGLIATSAALITEGLHPGSRNFMLAGHQSTEPGHVAALQHLQLTPLVDLQMRLGEGTGALAALPLVDLAAVMVGQMATLSELELG